MKFVLKEIWSQRTTVTRLNISNTFARQSLMSYESQLSPAGLDRTLTMSRHVHLRLLVAAPRYILNTSYSMMALDKVQLVQFGLLELD